MDRPKKLSIFLCTEHLYGMIMTLFILKRTNELKNTSYLLRTEPSDIKNIEPEANTDWRIEKSLYYRIVEDDWVSQGRSDRVDVYKSQECLRTTSSI